MCYFWGFRSRFVLCFANQFNKRENKFLHSSKAILKGELPHLTLGLESTEQFRAENSSCIAYLVT